MYTHLPGVALAVAYMAGAVFVDHPSIVPTGESPKFTTTDTTSILRGDFEFHGSTYRSICKVESVAQQHRKQDRGGVLVKTPVLFYSLGPVKAIEIWHTQQQLKA